MLNKNLQVYEDGYAYQIYDSVSQVDTKEWNHFIDCNQDIAMDQRLIHLMEKTLANQAKFWTVVFRKNNELIACANLSLFKADIIQSAPFLLKKMISGFRAIKPNMLKWDILFCGLPIPSGHSQLRFSKQINTLPILNLLNQIMHELAKEQRARLIVLKEFAHDELSPIDTLSKFGFCKGEIAPLFVLSHSFENFDTYLAALRANYRHQIQTNIKKFEKSNLTAHHFIEPKEITEHFDEQVYQLYLNVWAHAKERLECLPISFFQELPKTMPNQVALTLIRDQDKPVAFAIGLIGSDYYYNLYTGLDYGLKEETDLYFNLFYHEIDHAFKFQKKGIFLGQTSDSFKSRLGADASARFFFVRAHNPVLQIIFKTFHSFIFPKIRVPNKKDVFK